MTGSAGQKSSEATKLLATPDSDGPFFAFWIWFGILAIIGSLFSWLFALKSVPLVIAFNLAATNHVMVAIGSCLFLGETISSQRWIGIFLVALGVFL